MRDGFEHKIKMNALQRFYKADLELAARNHDKMAELQAAAGRPDLAKDSRRTAIKRRVAAKWIEAGDDVQEALQYAEDVVNNTTGFED